MPYFILVGRDTSNGSTDYELIFGDYDRDCVYDEIEFFSDYSATRIIRCPNDLQATIDEKIKILNEKG